LKSNNFVTGYVMYKSDVLSGMKYIKSPILRIELFMKFCKENNIFHVFTGKLIVFLYKLHAFII
jgi:hypothetical protein